MWRPVLLKGGRKDRKKVKNAFLSGFAAFDDELRKLKFSDLLSKKSYENPSICWEERVKKVKENINQKRMRRAPKGARRMGF